MGFFRAGIGRQVGRLARSLAEVGIMIVAAVLALFYRAAIGSQSELKIMTVGTTPPPKQVGCFSERLSAGFFRQKGVQTT